MGQKPTAESHNTMSETFTKTRVRSIVDLAQPPMYKVIYINDNQTSVDFVIDSLVEYFQYSQDDAQNITLDIHNSGSAVVAVLPYEIAEQKGIEITVNARAAGYPLQIKLEPENK